MNTSQTTCKLCKHPGWDLRLLGCGCTIHARCLPMSLVLDTKDGSTACDSILPAPNISPQSRCPICHSGTVTGIFIEPLCFNDVERAIALKKNEIPSLGMNIYNPQKHSGRKHSRDEDIEIEAESPYLLLSNGNSSISCSGLSKGQQRTGRWTNEESALVDFLVTTFDQGLLPLPHGIKLNEYLGDMLLCKSSRLTKKMKNAKLSTRSFVLGKPSAQIDTRDRERLSKLEEDFLASLSSESTRLVLKLNLTKQWRTHFYNICLQIGYPRVQAKAWNASLQELERRAKRAEEIVRSIRRRKMGLSSQYGHGTTFVNPNPTLDFIKEDVTNSQSSVPNLAPTSVASNDQKCRSSSHASIVSNDKPQTISPNEEAANSNYDGGRFSGSRQRALSTDMSLSSVGYKHGRDRTFSEDFDHLLDVLTEETGDDNNVPKDKAENSNRSSLSNSASNFCKPLLDAIATFMETHNLPFQHVDLWLPSFSSGELAGQVRALDVDQLHLFHAGHVCRRDMTNDLARMLHEFGVYSSYFSFEPGKGLPGRVYSTGAVSWECDVNQKDPNDFGRVEGAELYGVKTALAIPVNTAMVGRIVVILYSFQNVPEDSDLVRDVSAELNKYSVEPKWKLVLNSNSTNDEKKSISDEKTSAVHSMDFSAKSTTISSLDTTIIKPSEISMISYDHSSTAPSQQISSNNRVQTRQYQNEPRAVSVGSKDEKEDHELAAFLQSNMPILNDSSSAGQMPISVEERTLRPYFFSFRLLLLRPRNERTPRENEIIRILKKSFSSYLVNSHRNGKELAKLLVKDWVCLKSTYAFHKVSNQQNQSSLTTGAPRLPSRNSPTGISLTTYRSTSSVPEGNDQCGSPSLPSVLSTPLGLISDIPKKSTDASSLASDNRSTAEASSSSSTIIIDHTLYLPRKSSVDSSV